MNQKFLLNTAQKVSVLGVILVRIFRYGLFLRIQSECGRMRTSITPNTGTFHVVEYIFHGNEKPIQWARQKEHQMVSMGMRKKRKTGKKHPKIKLQRLRKIQILTFGLLLHQINSFQEVVKLEKNFPKKYVVTGKTPLFVIGSSYSRHCISLNTGF